MREMFKTQKGTELPIRNLKGKEYLDVRYRVVWFREEKPDWSIETEMISVTQDSAYAKATVRDEQGRIRATGHKSETRQGFADFIEKSETGAIGRALALIGYGTQFCADELEEGDRIVDSPVEAKKKPPLAAVPSKAVEVMMSEPIGEMYIRFGKKFENRRFKDCQVPELRSYADWICKSAKNEGKPLSPPAQEFVRLVDLYSMEVGI